MLTKGIWSDVFRGINPFILATKWWKFRLEISQVLINRFIFSTLFPHGQMFVVSVFLLEFCADLIFSERIASSGVEDLLMKFVVVSHRRGTWGHLGQLRATSTSVRASIIDERTTLIALIIAVAWPECFRPRRIEYRSTHE